MLKCTHIVLEFWGTLKFGVLEELAWKEKSYERAGWAREQIALGFE